MREFNLLEGYPQPTKPRKVGKNIRTIKNRIISGYRDKNFFDGDRNFGYGGFNYDGRWKKVAKKIIQEYKLSTTPSFLQINCEKGFLLNDVQEILPQSKIVGVETSEYACTNSMNSVKNKIKKVDNYFKLNFPENTFDFIIALGIIYTHTLIDAIKCLKEIQRVGNGKSFITLASYTDEKDYWLFKNWTLIGALILKKEEWVDVLKYANYTGDYYFTNAQTLNLQADNL
jgi:ubiquinone/menaquinone biosynthesis C-methylase UbiE